MAKKLCFVLSMTIVCYWADAFPVNLDRLELDKLDANLDDLTYDVEEEDLDDFAKLLDDAVDNQGNYKSKTNVKTSGFKKKNTANKGLKSEHDIKDLKKFFKEAGIKDQGAYDDDKTYAEIAALAAEGVGAKGTEERKYKKGTKTRGFHKIHHKDEYKKDKEFYEDDETTGAIKKVGGKVLQYKIGGGAGFNKRHFRHNHKKGVYGKEGYLDKGYLDKKYNGYSDADGYEGLFENE